MHFSSPCRPFQFSLATGLWGLSAAAALCAVTRWLGAIPYRGMLPAAALVIACVVARRKKSADVEWALLAIASCWALGAATLQMIRCFSVMGSPNAAMIHQNLVEAYWSATALPLVFAVPSVLLIYKASQRTSSAGRKWLVLCSLLAMLNGVVLTRTLIWVVDHNQW